MEEVCAQSLTEETINWMRVADMIGSTLEEVCHLPELERIALLSLLPPTDAHTRDIFRDQLIGFKDKDEKRRDDVRTMVISELHKDVEVVKRQLHGVQNIPSDEEIYAYLEAHFKEGDRVQKVVNELLGNNIALDQSEEISLKLEDENELKENGGKRKSTVHSESNFIQSRKRKRSNSFDETGVPAKIIKMGGSEMTSPFRQPFHLDENQIDKKKCQNFKRLNNNMEQIVLPARKSNTNYREENSMNNPTTENTRELHLTNVKERNFGNQMEIQDKVKDIEEFVKTVLEIVPNVDREYLRVRARDLVGDDAAIERFILEILNDPSPPANWSQIYAQPSQALKQSDGFVGQEKGVRQITKDELEEGPTSSATRQIATSTGPLELNDTAKSRVNLILKSIKDGSESIKKFPLVDQPEMTLESPGTSSSGLGVPPPFKNLTSGSSDDFTTSVPSPIQELEKSFAGPSIAPASQVLPEETEEDNRETMWQRGQEAYLIEIFPDYSPEWLVQQIEIFKSSFGTDDVRFNEKVDQIMEMEKSNIPTRKEWEKQVELKEELDKWSGNMTVNDMLELYGGEPAKHFDDPMRKGVVDNNLYKEYSKAGLMDAFRYAGKPFIDRELRKAKYSFAVAHLALQKMPNTRKTKRANAEIQYPARPCIEFVKEKKFVELRKSIDLEKLRRETEKRKAFEAARLTNALVECECCYNECLDQDMVPCNAGHLYCKECIRESVNVAMGEGKSIISCLGQCQEEINTRELQLTLPPNVLSKLLSKRQADEVGAAEIENLVTCPFCPYSTIMENPEDKMVLCRNPDCGRESCRMCKEPNHIPLRCDEVKSKDDIRKRVEEALSDAIIRKCANPKCPASFMKTEGCNKMVCQKCGTVQCYLCKEIVPGYEHFYGQGGEPTKTRVCPLWSDNDELHESEVSKAAQKEAEDLKKDGVEFEYNPKEGIKLLQTKSKK